MGLREVGVAKLHTTGKSLHIEYEPLSSLFKQHLFIQLEGLKKVLDRKQALVKVVTVVYSSQVSEKFDA